MADSDWYNDRVREFDTASEWEAEEAEPVPDIQLTLRTDLRGKPGSSNPQRPRTRAIGYDVNTGTLRVQFRDGAVYDYHDVTRREWKNIRRVVSVGKFMNRNLLGHEYTRIE